MIRVTSHIRGLYAYTLLLVMAMQWLAGFMYFHISYLVESTPVMNTIESAISNDVLDQYGMRVHVMMVDDDTRSYIQGLGYAAPFIHQVEIDGALKAFTLGTGETEYQNIEVALDNPADMQHDQQHRACLDKLFTQFCFGQIPYADFENQIALTENNFSVISLHQIFSTSYPGPPPRVV